jgi:hypothetical protein
LFQLIGPAYQKVENSNKQSSSLAFEKLKN